MPVFNRTFLELTSSYHLDKTCETFLNNKSNMFDKIDYFLVYSLVNGNFDRF